MNDIRSQERDPETYSLIGAAMEVHRVRGAGFSEMVYQESLAIEFELRGIPFRREVEVPILYKGRLLGCGFRADFICFGNVIVELKAIKMLTGIERAQVINYLKATGFERAVLFNFGSVSLEYERLILSSNSSSSA